MNYVLLSQWWPSCEYWGQIIVRTKTNVHTADVFLSQHKNHCSAQLCFYSWKASTSEALRGIEPPEPGQSCYGEKRTHTGELTTLVEFPGRKITPFLKKPVSVCQDPTEPLTRQKTMLMPIWSWLWLCVKLTIPLAVGLLIFLQTVIQKTTGNERTAGREWWNFKRV